MKINFNNIRYKNILSTGNVWTNIDLNKHKTTLVVGSNGSGKSTILDALSLCLFNKPFRKCNKNQLLNSINDKELLVEVDFTITNQQYKVVRGIKPNRFEIYCNDELINQTSSTKDYQEVLEKQILKMNHKIFSQIIGIGSATFIPFMQLNAQQRREIIEDLLDIQVFSVMNSLLKDKFSEFKEKYLVVENTIENIEQKISLHQKYKSSIDYNYNQSIEQKKTVIDQYNANKTVLMIKIDELQSTINDLNKYKSLKLQLDEKLCNITSVKSSLLTKQKHIEKDILFLNNNDECGSCGQDISNEYKETTIKNKEELLNQIEDGINSLVNKEINIKQEIATYNQKIELINSAEKQIHSLKNSISIEQSVIDRLNNEILQLKTDNDQQKIDQEISDLKNKLGNIIDERQILIEDKHVLDVASVLLKDGGIKTKIIKQYIPTINKMINKYLSDMDFFVNFTIDENLQENIMSRHHDQFSYSLFSEGEKCRIDLALIFAWRSITAIRNSTTTNLLIFDEVFDGSLDTQGSEEFIKIIDTLAKDMNIFIISHKTDQMLEKFDNVIKFEKYKNFSRIVSDEN